MTTTMTTSDGTIELATAEEFAERVFGVLNDSALCLLLSLGHRVGLLETLATLSPSTSPQIAGAAGLHERYVREWLDGMTVARVVEHDPSTATYWLPTEHAACLTAAAGPNNLAQTMQLIPLLAGVEDQVAECFVHGGGVGYEAYPRFHQLMAADSRAVHDAGLLDLVVPVIPGLRDRLSAGSRVADVGCGSGHAVNLLARAFPNSTFVGYDFSTEAIQAAQDEADSWRLSNASFVVCDIATLDAVDAFDVVTAFDVIHDLARPAAVLGNIARALRPGGVFLMVDINASSQVTENLDLPGSTFLYAVSLMHCMTVSLAQGGAGLGTAWGRQRAEQMLLDAGFAGIETRTIDTDPFNVYYVANPPVDLGADHPSNPSPTPRQSSTHDAVTDTGR